MLVDFALEVEGAKNSAEESIFRACTLRFRPILMTTMAALLGGVPLMLGTGNGAELRQPLATPLWAFAAVADSHPLYDAGRLSVSRSAGA